MLNSNFFAALLLLTFISGFFTGHLHYQMDSYGSGTTSNLNEKSGGVRKGWKESPYAEEKVEERASYGVWNSRPNGEELVCGGGDGDDAVISIDPFPPDFDDELYRRLNRGYGSFLRRTLNREHYYSAGRADGLTCSRGQNIRAILDEEIASRLVATAGNDDKGGDGAGSGGGILEIGPFLQPAITVPGVRYFDVLDLEGLKARANKIGYPSDPNKHPEKIHYVHPTGDLGSIHRKFGLVFSSHTIEHQLDLIRHLRAVSRLLTNGGYYAMLVPDKRYCFDRYVAESTIADVLDDHEADRAVAGGRHKLKSVIEHRALTVKNDAGAHWRGDSGPRHSDDIVDRIRRAMDEYDEGVREEKYVDVHNYQFTPQSLAFLVDTLNSLGYVDLRVHRLYETVRGKFEFCIVLRKCSA